MFRYLVLKNRTTLGSSSMFLYYNDLVLYLLGGNKVLMNGICILGSVVVPGVENTASAIRLLVERNKVVAEGAGAISVAAALEGKAGSGKVVCVVSGASIDNSDLIQILQGKIPEPH